VLRGLPLLMLLSAVLPAQAALSTAEIPGDSARSRPATVMDPMRPPPFALRQYRLEKQTKQAGTAAPKPSRKSTTRWVLNSILYAPGRQRAIVNGRLLAVGERIGGARLVAIERDRVRLRLQDRSITLKLGTARLDLKKTRKR